MEQMITLSEMSAQYISAAALLRARLQLLRKMLKKERDPELRWHLQRRIEALKPMLTEMNELADLTAHYYDRGYYRNEKYTLQRIYCPAAIRGCPTAADAQGD